MMVTPSTVPIIPPHVTPIIVIAIVELSYVDIVSIFSLCTV